MNKSLFKVFSLFTILALMLMAVPMQSAGAAGSVSLAAFGTAYTQDFNTLASSGTANTAVPAGWEFSESGTNANTTYRAGTGSDNTGDTYSFGATSNSERAFGGLRSGSLVPLIGAQFTNNTGGTITSLAINYTGEQWRLGQNTTGRAADRLDFQLSIDATSITTGTWTDYDSLDFSSPVVAGTVGALNGNVSPNRTTIIYTITGLSVANGTSFWLRWADSDLIPGADDGLSVDDFSLTPNGTIPQPSLSVNDITLSEGNSGTTTFGFNVSLSSAAGAGGVTFDIATADGTAVAPGDYAAKPLTTVTIPSGSSSYTFNVLVNGDVVNEPDETFFVNVTNVNGATVTDNQGQGNITNDDALDSAPAVTSTVPADNATNVSTSTNITVNFSEPVSVNTAAVTLECPAGTMFSFSVLSATTNISTLSLDPVGSLPYNTLCQLTIPATAVSDADGNDPPDALVANFLTDFTTQVNPCLQPFDTIPAIQGSGASVALTGTRTTQGVVVADYEGPSPALRGFYIQDPTGDGNPATSDGIFVFEGSNANTVSVGDVVRVMGTAAENQGQSQISVGTIIKCGTGTVTPTDVTFPVASADFLEQYEGMLVRLPQTMYVTEHFQLGRFGQVVLSSGGKLQQPTNVVAPGAPANALQAQNDLNKIILDDGSQTQNPDPIVFARGGQPLSASNTLRGGDTATNIVGVMTYTWAGNAASGNAYRVRPINALNGSVNFQPTNPRPAAVPNVGGTVRVVGMNLLNFFNTFDGLPDNVDNCNNGVGGAATDCRGADTQSEFDRQWPKTVAAITAMNPDVVGVNELENDGYGPDSALQFLVDKLNAATAPGTYAFINVDANTGQTNAMGTDAIRVALLYKPAIVTPVGQTAALNTVAFVNGGDGAPRSRPSLMQAFKVNTTGAVFIVDVNHLKSKGSACDVPDAGDGQGNCNQERVNAVNELLSWFATDPTGTGDPDILMVGDYNSYAMEDPITALENGGFTHLIKSFLGPDAYSYVFDGQWGYLDHALASASLVGQVSGVADYHINSDEPSVLDYNTDFKTANLISTLYAPDQFRISDHDPVIIGLTPNAPPTVNANGPYLVNEGSSVTLNASGSDPNGDSLTYAWDLDNNGTFETSGQSVTFSAASLDGPSSYTVNAKATDPGGLSAVSSATVNVVNVAPSVNIPAVTPEPSIKGGAVTASATFSDPALNDAPFTCTVDYGDGSGVLAGVVSGNICNGPSHAYASVGSFTVTINITDKDNGTGSNATSHAVIYNFSGFFQPVDNLPTINSIKAGQAIPVKFSLNGNQGLNIFASGYPQIVFVACAVGTIDAVETTLTAGSSSLSYDPTTDQYTYVWKTDKTWAGKCGNLMVKFNDGTTKTAAFTFTK